MRWGLVACVLLAVASPASATIYRWVDEDGVVNFSDNRWRFEAYRRRIQPDPEPAPTESPKPTPPAQVATAPPPPPPSVSKSTPTSAAPLPSPSGAPTSFDDEGYTIDEIMAASAGFSRPRDETARGLTPALQKCASASISSQLTATIGLTS